MDVRPLAGKTPLVTEVANGDGRDTALARTQRGASLALRNLWRALGGESGPRSTSRIPASSDSRAEAQA